MQAVELFLVFWFLRQQPVHQRDHLHHSHLQRTLWNLVQLSFDVAQHPAGVASEFPKRLAHPFELAGVGIATDLTGQPGCQAVVILAQANPGLASQTDQLAPRRLIQPGVGRVSNALPDR